MRDSNYPLRKAYITRLASLSYNSVAVPVFYQYLPDGVSPDLYVIIESVSNNPNGTVSTQDSQTSITISIHSFGEKYANGQAVDNVAGQVLTLINPSPSGVLDLSADNLQMVSSKIVADNTQSFSSEGSRIYIDRILTFEHTIFQK